MARPPHVLTAGEVARLFGGSPPTLARPAPPSPPVPRRLPRAIPQDLMNTFGLTLELAVFRPQAPAAARIEARRVRTGGGRLQSVVTILLVASLLLGWGALAAGAVTTAAGYGVHPTTAGSLAVDQALPLNALHPGGPVLHTAAVVPLAGYAVAALQFPGARALQVMLPLLLLAVLFHLASRRHVADDADLIASQSQETSAATV